MMITPGELLDTSIAQLQTLAAFLGDQLGDKRDRPESATSASERRPQCGIHSRPSRPRSKVNTPPRPSGRCKTSG